MHKLTQQGQEAIVEIASRYGLSQETVLHMLDSVITGGGVMAQFNCPELGGNGQWMQGGMTMVGDMFNYGLKATVDSLCTELSNLAANHQVYEKAVSKSSHNSNNWWPAELGFPNSTGAQNNIRYAYFANANRLVIDINNEIKIYNTLDHQINGVSQQQGSPATFTSQYGTVNISSLPIVSINGQKTSLEKSNPSENISKPIEEIINNNKIKNHHSLVEDIKTPNSTIEEKSSQNSLLTSNEIISLIEQLGKLKDAGILTEEEFNNKKTELLSRI
ncbi:SHOCT domain-containing protein [Pseudofrancisella aestuarii]|uniref:SHOCT domain-containing protein n=1 Tax=Pseudofrancisella aestuarii TaxID=2670347 RepID=A0ABV9TE48_9GAMM|nr:SHOCT domain-containing protein [Pseudofrancisella aestuarii]